jgi:UDP-N-acetylmuramate-alanine ligase
VVSLPGVVTDSPDNIKSIHFIGVCGTAMAAVAKMPGELGHP